MTSTGRTDDGRRSAKRGPSMLDVAREAGVSGQTVSRVTNGRSNVEDATRARVLAAMDRLGYRPNGAARALRSGRFRNIGVIMFTLSTYGNMRTLDGIANAAARAGYSITLMPVAHATQRDVNGAFDRLAEQAVDGVIIVIEIHQLDESAIELPTDVPVVIVDSNARGQYPVVDTDQTQGAQLATEHLLDLGHDTVWHITGPVESFSANRRRDSWEATLRRRGAVVPEVLVGDWSAELGYEHGRALAANPEVTAVFAANDQTALGVLRAMHEAGRDVPGDVSVVGFDDMAEAASFWPPLTTVRQHFADVGAKSVETLLHEIEHDAPVGDTIVGTELVQRGSTARRT
jgi:DNA-binding LacI/PurR family transcriptional regulator